MLQSLMNQPLISLDTNALQEAISGAQEAGVDAGQVSGAQQHLH